MFKLLLAVVGLHYGLGITNTAFHPNPTYSVYEVNALLEKSLSY